MAEAFNSFAEWFARIFTIPWWALLLALGGLGILYRLYRVLTADQREVARRYLLVEDLRKFINEAERANVEMAQSLREMRLREHAQRHVERMPVGTLEGKRVGIGQQTIAALRSAGFAQLGDVLRRDARQTRNVGDQRRDAVLQFITVEAEAAYHKLKEGGDIPLDPEVEEKYQLALAELGVQNQRLENDLEGLAPAADEFRAYEQASNQRTTKQRLREWLRSPFDDLSRHPVRVGRGFIVAVLFVMIASGLPFAAIGWGVQADACGPAAFGAGFFALVFYFAVYIFASERAATFGTRSLDATNFQEQRLQFLGLTMALTQGIAPPEVRMTDEDTGDTRGGRSGPSLISMPSSKVKQLARHGTQDEVAFLLAHEVGRLSGDHQRVISTVGSLMRPFGALSNMALSFVAYLAASVVALFTTRQTFGSLMLVLLAGFLLLGLFPVLAAVVLVYVAVSAVRVTLASQSVFDADRTARELTSDDAMKNTMETLHARGYASETGAEAGARGLIIKPEDQSVRAILKRKLKRGVAFVAKNEPGRRARLSVFDRRGVSVGYVAASVARSLFVLGCAWSGLYVAAAQVRFVSELYPTHAHQSAPGASPVAAAPVVPVRAWFERTVRVRGAARCQLRHAPAATGRPAGTVADGAPATVRPSNVAGWLELRRDGQTSYIADGCIANAP